MTTSKHPVRGSAPDPKARNGRLFVLDLSGGRVLSMRDMAGHNFPDAFALQIDRAIWTGRYDARVTMRELPKVGACPSATKISPLDAIATDVG